MRNERLQNLGPWLLDLVLALGTAQFAVVFLQDTLAGTEASAAAPHAVLYGLALAHTLPLVVRRRYPRAVLVSSLVTAAMMLAAGPPLFFLGPAIFVVLYTVASRCDRGTSLAGLTAAQALWGVSVLLQDEPDAGTWLIYGVFLAGAWMLGENVRRRQEYARVLEERAAQLQRAREELARQAVSEERLRIARELHDVVAHSMSVIAVQSGVGAHVIDVAPDEARKALTAIEYTSRAALTEMRRLLGVLRQDGDEASLRPAPGMADLDELRQSLTEAGLAVRVDVDGDLAGVPPAVDLSAYRIVQEALTNVIKHAGATTAHVVLRRGPAALTVEVTDDGAGRRGQAAPNGTGHGLVGMRERVAMFGGELAAGPVPDGRGFKVVARLPFEGPAR